MKLGIATVAAITALCYIVSLIVKAAGIKKKWTTIICSLSGLVLGLLALYTKMPDFPAADPITAAAVGSASGLAATGIDPAVKRLGSK